MDKESVVEASSEAFVIQRCLSITLYIHAFDIRARYSRTAPYFAQSIDGSKDAGSLD